MTGDFNLYLNPRLDKLDQINESQDKSHRTREIIDQTYNHLWK